ncbi:MAG: hypothetical protein GY943_29630 [Chloroflexi bacterium]|nr:hypothetical protein [Chloroflexota bacterium]
MYQIKVDLDSIRLQFISHSFDIFAEWQKLFHPYAATSSSSKIQLDVEFTITVPIASPSAQFYDPVQQLSVQQDDGAWVLTFDKLATIRVEPQQGISRGLIVADALANGRFIDITYTALAPHLRRRGIYLIHAFGAVKNGRSILLVGASGSGKTTAGLSLLQDGWQLLGNDIIMLSIHENQVVAWPTPGDIRIRSQTIGLVDGLENGRFPYPPFVTQPAPVTHILFPQISLNAQTKLMPAQISTVLARLMAESIDRWDIATLQDHVRFLQRMGTQTAVYDLQSGQNISQLSHLFSFSE